MPDPFAEAFAEIGEDFETLFEGVLTPCTVREIQPDTGATITEVEDVPALKRARRRFRAGVDTGEVGGDQCRFVFRAERASWVVKHRDEVEVQADGTVWVVDERGAELIAFGNLWACDVTLKRE